MLLRTLFLGPDEADDKRETGVSDRVAVARAIQNGSIPVDWLAPDAEAILVAIEKKCGQQPALFRAEIRFHFKILQQFVAVLHLHENLLPLVHQLNTQLLAHAIADARFWWQDRQVKNLANRLCAHLAGWEPTFGVTSEALLTHFRNSLEKFAGLVLLDQENARALGDLIDADHHKLMDKFERLGNRLKETEIGQLKAAHGKAVVARFLNQAMQGQKLPAYIAKPLQTHWLNEMQILLIRQGDNSALWLRWKKMLETMIRFYQPEVPVPEDAVTRNIMLQLPNEFEQLIAESMPSKIGLFEDFCNELAYDFSQKMAGMTLDGLVTISPVAVDGEVAGIEKKVSSILLGKAKKFALGQWFLYTDESNRKSRCRLLISIPEFDQLLFVTLVGQKSVVLDYERFAYLLSARLMQPLLQENQLQVLFSSRLDKLLENFEEIHEARLSLRKQKELEARKAREENEKREAAEKARAEAEAIARRKAEEEQQILLAKVADDMKRQARLAINSLALGSWIEIYNEEGKNYQRGKLVVKYAATGRFVFVDADGITVADCQRDELVELMMKRKVKLLDSDGQFAERLTQIIKNIRKVD